MSHPNQQLPQHSSQNSPHQQPMHYPVNAYHEPQTRDTGNLQGPNATTNYPNLMLAAYPQTPPVQSNMMPRGVHQPQQPTEGGYNPQPTPHQYIPTPPPVTPGVFPNPNSSPFTTTPREAVQTTSPQAVRYQCDKCGTTFSRMHDRNRHYESTHAKNPPVHKCERCMKLFSRADAKKRHQDDAKCSNSS